MEDSHDEAEKFPGGQRQAIMNKSELITTGRNGEAKLVQQPAAALGGHESLNGMSALHSVRRRWPHMIVSGVVCGALFAGAAYFLFQEKYRSYATLRIHSQAPRLAFRVEEAEQSSQFEVYKRTQRELVLGDQVLKAALEDANLRATGIVEETSRTGDPVLWLRKQLRVEFPGDAEIMMISMEGRDRNMITLAVDAVVNAYEKNVTDFGRESRNNRIKELKLAQEMQEEKARLAREKLVGLTRDLGSGDSEALSARQQVAIQQYAQLQAEHTRVEIQMRALGLQLDLLGEQIEKLSPAPQKTPPSAGATQGEVASASRENVPVPIETPEAPPLELDSVIQRDPAVTAQREVVAKALLAIEDVKRRVSAANHQLVSNLEQVAEIEKQKLATVEKAARDAALDKYKAEWNRARQAEIAALRRKRGELEVEWRTLELHKKELDDQLTVATAKADKIGTNSVSIELTRKDLERLEALNDRIRTEIETLTIEQESPARVLALGPAHKPETPSTESRIKRAATLGALGFLLPCIGLFFLDHQRKLVSGQSEVVGMPKLRPLGSVPILPRLGFLTNGKERQVLALREAVDGIRTVLIHEADLSDYRIIQITSAVSGEAKTTFASQLARSLSRANRRTVLVDLDLRRPSMHEVFGLELTSGVSEVLRGEAQIEDVLLPSDQDRLALLFAGRCDATALTALTNNAINDMLSRLREQFEFVIVDSSPVLPVVDGLLVAQRADAVIIMAMRDVSRAPQLREATDRLWQIGANVIGSVVTTKESRSYYQTRDRYAVV